MRSDDGSPKPTGKPPELVSLDGALVPWLGDRPAMLEMPGSDALYLPCFSTVQKLDGALRRARVHFLSVKHVDDGLEFLDSIPKTSADGRPIRVIFDPWFTFRGTVRFVEIQR